MSDRLYRSRSDRMLAGVAGGLAEMWNADPSLVRIVWALLVILTGGVALLVYIVMAIVVPEGDPVPWPSTSDAATSTEPFVDPATGAPLSGDAPPIAGAGWSAAPTRQVRARPRGESNPTVPLILGGFLVLLGAFFLVREFLPEIDFDWFWPALLIVLGVVILVSALGRDRGGPGASS
jgi:phage shock protein C